MLDAMLVQRWPSSSSDRCSTPRITFISSLSVESGEGTAPAFSYSTPLWTSRVASPPSSRIMFGPPPSGQRSTCSVHHQYSSSVSPFQAYTGAPRGSSGVPSGPTTTAAAAWSCVEKMLQLAQRTSAPSATSVSISTAVCTVMCSDPVMRGQLDPVAQARVKLGVLQEHGRERRHVAADLVVVGLRQLRGEGRRLGVLVDLALPAPRCGDRRPGAVHHRDGLAQR